SSLQPFSLQPSTFNLQTSNFKLQVECPPCPLLSRARSSDCDASVSRSRGRHGVWIKAAPGRQARAIKTDPQRFFVPPYVGPSGWVGVYLDAKTDWKE